MLQPLQYTSDVVHPLSVHANLVPGGASSDIYLLREVSWQ
jgi:hypothetical protein